MAARSLTTTEDHTYIHFCGVGHIALFKLNKRHAIRIGEERLDLFLVIHALCRSTLFYLYCTLKSLRQLRLIGSTRLLQCTFFHLSIEIKLKYLFVYLFQRLSNQVQKYGFSWRFGKNYE